MSKNKHPELADHLIEKYRELLQRRYNYQRLLETYSLPASITEEVVEEVKHYFLECLYPPSDQRHRLEKAFENLDTFISKPSKMLSLIGSMTKAIFRFGIQFPKALKAGMASLKSYRDASQFEEILLKAALKRNLQIPISLDDFKNCMADIPRHKAKNLIYDIKSLLEAMSDTALVARTIEILQGATDKMRHKPNLYEDFEVDGVKLGIDILHRGHDLMSKYDKKLKKTIVEFIVTNEEAFLREVYQ